MNVWYAMVTHEYSFILKLLVELSRDASDTDIYTETSANPKLGEVYNDL